MTVVTYGETMLRLTPAEAGELFADAGRFRVTTGGSESNVAVALARLDVPARHVTRLPEGPLGDRVAADLLGAGVDAGAVARGGARVGLYWTETGVGPRASRVVYDRDGSAFAEASPGDFDLVAAFAGASLLHVSGITPALSARARDALLAFVDARPEGVPVSVDLNHRAKLWRWTADAAEVHGVMWDLVSRAETVFANEADLADALGLDVSSGFEGAAAACFERLPSLELLAVSVRESASASDNSFGGALFRRSGRTAVAEPRPVGPVVDRLGTGDAFAAGVIDGLLAGRGDEETLAFAVALASLCHTVAGDHSRFGRAEVEHLVADSSGRVVR